MIRNLVSSRSAPSIGRSEVENGRNKSNEKIQQQEEKCDADGKDSEQSNKPKNKLSKYKPFKNTALVLRDVKNSIELRMKARHESKSFAKLTNELATPSAKLYSPFNIYTPSCSGGKGATGLDSTAKTKDLSKSARRNKLNKKRERVNRLALEHSMTTMNDSGLDCSMTLTPASTTTTTSSSSTLTTTPASSMSDQEQPSMTAHGRTPRDRIAWRHKKHLMQENVFASFASPTGRLRETVKDVEHFQQCIEDISMAIRARGGGDIASQRRTFRSRMRPLN